MVTNAEVVRGENENNVGVLRRFTRRVQGTGVLNQVRARRFFERVPSSYKRRVGALKRLTRNAKFHELSKLGKIKPKEARA
jgi:ribosomal protein S21